jgi:3-oxoacyl-[acyl-carrier-protein] synthase-3
MKCIFRNKRISAILSVVPGQESRFDDERSNYNLTEEKARRMKKMMGLDRHRVAAPGVCSSDLCVYGLQQLLNEGTLKKEEIGALLFVSQTPDYYLPPTSNVIQGRLGLGCDVVCLDLNQGCAGFVIGLMQAFMLLDMMDADKVVLLNGDTASKLVDKHNRITYPLIGDAGSVTIIERCAEENPVHLCLKMDGSRHRALIVPGGAFRTPSSPESLKLVEVEEGVVQSLEQIHMDGAAIFNFTLEDVPPQIEEVLSYSGNSKESIDYFLFHQPNQFILKQMADKMKIPQEKLPNNIVGIYGNSSSVSIPVNITHNCGQQLQNSALRVCLSGFGVGLTWGSMVMNLGPLATCQTVDYEAV